MRSVVIILIGLLSCYLLWLGVRWLHLGSRQRRRAPGDFMVLKDVPAAHARGEYVDTEAPFLFASATHGEGSGATGQETAFSRTSIHAKADEAPAGFEPGVFQTSPFETTMELRQLRHALTDLQAQHEQLAAQVLTLREDLEAVQAAARVSPQYGEAVSLARQGFDAQDMAERCGISVSEAELVRALAGVTHKEDS